ncbi:MAG: YHS domain-containing protein, partial [Candidatus Bathyarchaeota archaeon]
MRDLVCNKDVQSDEFTLKVGNNRFYFCSQDCLEKFKTNPKDFIEQHINDLIIIGAGPAGLTAAVYASTLRINTFLISMEMGGQIIDSSKIENYLGFQLISGPELIKKFED